MIDAEEVQEVIESKLAAKDAARINAQNHGIGGKGYRRTNNYNGTNKDRK